MHVPDMAKFGRSEQLHFAVQAVLAYREKHGELPAVRDAAAAKECVDLAKQINEARKKGRDGASLSGTGINVRCSALEYQ